MATPVTYKGNGIIQIMSTSDFNGLAQAVLEHMAQNDGPGGIYASNVGNASFTLIGTFTDTGFQQNTGSEDLTILTNEYSLYQDLTTPTGDDPPAPLKYTSSSVPLQIMTEQQINEMADSILQYCVTQEGPHSFVLSNTTPSDGGTWASLGELKDDVLDSGNVTSSVFLFKKLSSGSYELNRPIKLLENTTFQNFTDEDVSNISKIVRERIVNTGVGQYLFQTDTPTPGTWVAKGSITNTLADFTSELFDAVSQESAFYTAPGLENYSGVGLDTGLYNQNAFRLYYTGDTLDSYESFTGSLNEIEYAGPGLYAGLQIPVVDYTELEYVRFVDYTSSTAYTGPGPTGDERVFLAIYQVGPTFTGLREYVRSPNAIYTNGFYLVGAEFITLYQGPGGTTIYAGDIFYYDGTSTNYLGPSGVLASYVRTYLGPAGSFDSSSYLSSSYVLGDRYTSEEQFFDYAYLGGPVYTNDVGDIFTVLTGYTVNYSRPQLINSTGAPIETSLYLLNQYTSGSSQYVAPDFINYTAIYAGDTYTNEPNSRTLTYTGPSTPLVFSGVYAGPTTGSYTREVNYYLRGYEADAGYYDLGYTGADGFFNVQYTGLIGFAATFYDGSFANISNPIGGPPPGINPVGFSTTGGLYYTGTRQSGFFSGYQAISTFAAISIYSGGPITDTALYQILDPTTYTGNIYESDLQQFYLGSDYGGPAYDGVGIYTESYAGTYAGFTGAFDGLAFTGVISYQSAFLAVYSSYTQAINYLASYEGDTETLFNDYSILIDYTGNTLFTGYTQDSAYTGTYSPGIFYQSVPAYTDETTDVFYQSTQPLFFNTYEGTAEVNFQGKASYTTAMYYTGAFNFLPAVNYTGASVVSYTGIGQEGYETIETTILEYTLAIIGSGSTEIETKTLWRRIA